MLSATQCTHNSNVLLLFYILYRYTTNILVWDSFLRCSKTCFSSPSNYIIIETSKHHTSQKSHCETEKCICPSTSTFTISAHHIQLEDSQEVLATSSICWDANRSGLHCPVFDVATILPIIISIQLTIFVRREGQSSQIVSQPSLREDGMHGKSKSRSLWSERAMHLELEGILVTLFIELARKKHWLTRVKMAKWKCNGVEFEPWCF